MKTWIRRVVALTCCGIMGSAAASAQIDWLGKYDPTLGTLPTAQGWSIFENGPQPAPFVAGGQLFQGPTSFPLQQYWTRSDIVTDFASAAGLVVEADLRIVSSNYEPGLLNAWRTGYIILLSDSSQRTAVLGIADTGIRISTDSHELNSASSAFIPLDTTSTVKTYQLKANAFGVTVSVNRVPLATLPLGTSNSVSANLWWFCDGTDSGASQTVLSEFRWGTKNPTWTDLGSGLAGANGVPCLTGTGTLIVPSTGSLDLSGAKPSAAALLLISVMSSPTPFKGGVLITVPPAFSVALTTDASGAASLPFNVLSALPPAIFIYFHCAIADPSAPNGVALSNALSALTP
jgi:hypothetical protein